jgi:L-lactate dehydrogenase complex protein LldF
VARDPWLPYASSLCGACGEVCPVKIDIPKLLLDLRADVVARKPSGLEKLAFRLWAAVMSRPGLYRAASAAAAVTGSAERRWVSNTPNMLAVGPLKAWLSERDLPAPAPKTFRQLWRERK